MLRPLVVFLTLLPLLSAAEGGSRVRYMGGTVAQIPNKCAVVVEVQSSDDLLVRARQHDVKVAYKDINTIEYGLRVSRRYMEAALISPVLLLSKKRQHFLTIGFTGEDGKQQAMVLQVDKSDIRPLLVSLEAKTGRRVEYQDDEARKAGKG